MPRVGKAWHNPDMKALRPDHPWLRWRSRLIGGAVVLMLAGLVAATAGRGESRRSGRIVAVASDGAIALRGTDGERFEVALRGVRPVQGRTPAMVRYLRSRLPEEPADRAAMVIDHDGHGEAGYVYLGPTLLNEAVIDAGYAAADRDGYHPLRRWFLRLERWARQDQRGLWAR